MLLFAMQCVRLSPCKIELSSLNPLHARHGARLPAQPRLRLAYQQHKHDSSVLDAVAFSLSHVNLVPEPSDTCQEGQMGVKGRDERPLDNECGESQLTDQPPLEQLTQAQQVDHHAHLASPRAEVLADSKNAAAQGMGHTTQDAGSVTVGPMHLLSEGEQLKARALNKKVQALAVRLQNQQSTDVAHSPGHDVVHQRNSAVGELHASSSGCSQSSLGSALKLKPSNRPHSAWLRKKDTKSGRYYYVHPVLRQTTWVVSLT
jgi:hypothetical protein